MPHEIDTTTGQAAVFVTGEPAWHGLGTRIEQATTSRQAIELARLDWQVEQWPLQAFDPTHERLTGVRDHVANVRTDTKRVLGVVGRQYQVFQNHEAFDFMDALVGDRLAMYETAGALRGGRRVWMLARIPKVYRASDDDVIEPYVLLVNSHDGSTALRMIATSVRVVCQNTLNLALRRTGSGTGGGAIVHRGSLDQRVREARRKLGLVAARFDQFDEELHAMLDKQLSTRQVTDYFQQLLPAATTDRQQRNRRERLAQFQANFENERQSMPGVRGTAWAAFNAVSEWADHQRHFRGRSEHARVENRLASVWFGASNATKQRAYQSALEMATH